MFHALLNRLRTSSVTLAPTANPLRLSFPPGIPCENLSPQRVLISHSTDLKNILEKIIKPEICGITLLNEYGCRIYIGEPINISKTTIKFCGCNLVEGNVTGKIGMIDLSHENGILIISKLAIEEGFRGQRYASRIIEGILSYSNSSNTPIEFSNVKNKIIDALLRRLNLEVCITGRKHSRINFTNIPNSN